MKCSLIPLLVILALPFAMGFALYNLDDFVEPNFERDYFFYYRELNVSEEYGYVRTNWLVNASVTWNAGELSDISEVVVYQGNNRIPHNVSGVVSAGGFVTAANLYFRVNCSANSNVSVRVYYNCSECPVLSNESAPRADMVYYFNDGSEFPYYPNAANESLCKQDGPGHWCGNYSVNWWSGYFQASTRIDNGGNPGSMISFLPINVYANGWFFPVNATNTRVKLSIDLQYNESVDNPADWMEAGFVAEKNKYNFMNSTTRQYAAFNWTSFEVKINDSMNNTDGDKQGLTYVLVYVSDQLGISMLNYTGFDNVKVTEEFDGKVYQGPQVDIHHKGMDFNISDYVLRNIPDLESDDRFEVYFINLSFTVENNDSINHNLVVDVGADNVPDWNSSVTAKTSVVVSLNSSVLALCSGGCVINFSAPSGGWFNYSNVTFTYFVFGNISYPSYVNELEASSFGSRFGVDLRTNSSLQLVTGGKRYQAAGSFNGIDVFNRTIYLRVGGVYPWYWDYNISLANGSEFSGTTQALNLSLFVQGFSFDSCSHGSANESVRFNHNYESDNASANGELMVWFKLWKNNPAEYVNRSFVGAYLSTHSYCLEPRNSSYNVEALSKFNSPDFVTYDQNYRPRDFWLHNLSVNGSVHNVYLFYVNTTAEVITVKVRDFNDHALAGAFVHSYRFYPGLNEWRLVESRRADNDGNMVMYLFAYNELYRFVVYYAGRVFVVTETMITSSEVLLRVDTLGDYLSGFNIYNNVIYSLDYINGSSMFTFEYNDLSQQVSQGCLRVTRQKVISQQVCEACSSTYYDVLSCTINQSVSGVYTAVGYITINGQEIPLADKSVGIGDFSNPLGFDGIIIGLIMIVFLTIFGAMIGGPVGALVGFDLGFVTSSIMFLSLPTGVIMTVVVLSGIAFWRMGR